MSPMFLIALVQYAMAAIILSTGVIFGFVMLLWMNCTVLFRHSLFVVVMWHRCVQ